MMMSIVPVNRYEEEEKPLIDNEAHFEDHPAPPTTKFAFTNMCIISHLAARH